MRGVEANNEDPQNQVEDLNVFKKKKEGRMMQLSKKFDLALCITTLYITTLYNYICCYIIFIILDTLF